MRTKLFLLSLITALPLILFSQNFTWVRGNNFGGAITGTYGLQGVANSGNDPGHRHGAATWVDASGNLWMFGGEGYSTSSSISWLNDLWKYNPSTNQWTWIRGSSGPNAIGLYGTQNVATSTNEPGAREFATTWTDNLGNFWLFGGDGFAGNNTFGRLGDLWKYNPTTNMWTWVKGFNTVDNNGVYGALNTANSGNLPGSRYAAASWVDASNNLWLFGGRGFPASGGNAHLNDLWVFNTTTGNWTWKGGTQLGSQNGLYGTLGVPSTTNIPGGIEFPCSWSDNSGNFYLFSGRGYVSASSAGYVNDLWRYNPATTEWTWLKGSNLINQSTVYGTQGVASSSVIPGGRYSSAYWKDLSGNFWLFGGFGFSGVIGSLNDLFKYNPATNEFTWMKGANTINANGNYGTQGITAVNNIPGARFFNTFWRNNNGGFWLLGGDGYDATATAIDNLNDLWKFDVPCNPDSISASPGKNICTGGSVSLTANNQFPASVQWYASPSSTQTIGTGSVLTTGNLTAGTSLQVYTYYAQANSCTLTPRTAINVTVNPIPVVSASGGSVCSGAIINLVATGANTYTWAGGPSSATYAATPTISATYTVTGASAPGCQNTATAQVVVYTLPTLSVSASHTQVCKFPVQNVTLTVNGANTYTWNTGANSYSVVVTPTIPIPSGSVTYTVNGTDGNGCIGKSTVLINVYPCGIGIAENSLHRLHFDVYPNPNHGSFVINLENEVENAQLTLINILGEVIHREVVNGIRTQLNLNTAKGLYFLSLEKNGERLGTARLVID